MRDVQWCRSNGQDMFILVRRDVYDAYAIMTLDQFRETEPYVEALAVLNVPGGMKQVVPQIKTRESDGAKYEAYYPVDEPTSRGAYFTMPMRQESASIDG